jgi:hypothetical protein
MDIDTSALDYGLWSIKNPLDSLWVLGEEFISAVHHSRKYHTRGRGRSCSIFY